MISNLLRSRSRSIQARPFWLFGIVALATMGWLTTGCSITDVFRTNPDDNTTAGATATAAPASVRGPGVSPDWRHRFFVSPSEGRYDPDLVAPSADDRLLDLAAERWMETESVHFNLDVDGTTYLDVNETIELKSVEGDLLRPDRTQAEANVQVGFASFDVDLIAIGSDAYMTNFLTGNWERAPSNFAFNPALIFDDERGVSSVLDKLNDVEVGDESTINGFSVAEITGTVEQRDISQLVAGSLRGDEVEVGLWVNVQSGSILQISLSEPDGVEGDPTTWTIKFTAHNVPVTIEAPEL